MAEDGNLRAGIYERVSVKLTGKEARSVAGQNARNLSACEENGWTVAGRYADPGVSASRYARQKRRAEYERLREDVASGLLDVIVVWKANRIDRKLGEWSALLEECRERGVKIYITYGGGHLYDPRNGSDWRQLATDGVAAAADSDQISADVKRGMQENLKAGKPHGPVPYGYRRDYDEYRNITGQVPDPETGPVRRGVIERVAKGDALTAIARDLEDRGVKAPRGKTWSTSSVRSLVLSPVNVAKRRYDPEFTGTGEPTPGADWWKPLIDEPTWIAACNRLRDSQRGSGQPGQAHVYLLSYLVMCGGCGGKVGVRKGRWSVPAYCCWWRGCTGIRHDWLDDYVTGHVCTILNKPEFWDELMNPDDAEGRAARAEEADLRRRLAAFEEQAIAGGAAADSFGRVITGLKARIRDAERRGKITTAPPHLLELYRRKDTMAVAELFGMQPIATRKAILRDLYDGIILLPALRPGRNTRFDPARVRMVLKGSGTPLGVPPVGIG